MNRPFASFKEENVMRKFKIISTLAICFGILIPALLIPGVSTVWKFVGSSIVPIASFVFPAACFIAFSRSRGLQVEYLYRSAVVMLIIGLFVAMVATTFNLILSA